MSEPQKRTIAQIQEEYQGMCLKLGHTQYQVFTLQKDVDLMNQTLRDLNIEASKLKQDEVAAAEAPAKKDDN